MVPTYLSSFFLVIFCASVASRLSIFQPSSVGVNLVKGQHSFSAFACFFFLSSVRFFAAAAPSGAQQWSYNLQASFSYLRVRGFSQLVRNESVYQNEALTIPHYYPPADEMNMTFDVSLELSLFV